MPHHWPKWDIDPAGKRGGVFKKKYKNKGLRVLTL